MSAIIHIGTAIRAVGQPVLQRQAALDRLAELPPDAHRLPEDVGQPRRLRVLGHLRPAVDRRLDQRVPPLRVVVVAVGEDRELRADREPAEVAR